MEQDRPVREAVPAEVWVEDRVEAGWAGRSPQDQAEIVFVQNVAIRFRILLDNRVIKKTAQSAARK